ncbi:hypothetical protein ACN38_g4942 [Penicillium nordicum]|uniref:Uncharacterized protein n=1 Tax=Penicillium nordicum TaxID=229535 RepID=A0A0M9WGM9_9EURO|nr:hypothetical protein ACN38_g4942 [Penicillium nordicum]
MNLPRIGIFVLFEAHWAPIKAQWAFILGPRPIDGPKDWPKDQPICGLVRVGLWALWAGAEVYTCIVLGLRLDLRIAHRPHSLDQPNPQNGLVFGPMLRPIGGLWAWSIGL